MKHGKLMGFLTITGLIMIFIPLNLAIIMLLYSAFRVEEAKTLFEFPDITAMPGHVPGYLPVTAGILFIIGLFMLSYVIYARHRRKNQG